MRLLKVIKRFFGIRKRGFEMLEDFHKFYAFSKLPTRKTYGSAGYDIYALGDYIIEPGQKVVVDTGLTAYMEEDEFLAIVIRSGLSYNHNLTLQNGFAVIDSDFYGDHIRLMVRNEGEKPFKITSGMRMAQGIFFRYLSTNLDNNQKKQKRKGGFGSTGLAA